jgi:hypothetical protein
MSNETVKLLCDHLAKILKLIGELNDRVAALEKFARRRRRS